MLKALQYANALNLIEKELNDMATTTFYLDEEIINQVFDGKIITSLDHEALIRNVGGQV